ncbi:MAG: esterase/lipase family protein [Bdellovibrionia bacterium]
MSQIPEALRDSLREKHVLFVPGFMNEVSVGNSIYYRSNIQAAEAELGMGATYFPLPSSRPVEENSAIIADKVNEIYQREGRPVILVGHSKGGAESLHSILKYPELILDEKVDRVVLLQSAIGGSPLATPEQPGVGLRVISYLIPQGLQSLSPGAAKQLFDEAFGGFVDRLKERFGHEGENKLKEKIDEVSKKVFYVRSVEEPQNWSWGTQIVHRVCGNDLRNHGQSDGLLLIDDQIDQRIGVDLGVIQADHIDLAVDGVFSSLSSEDRRAFTRALFASIYSCEWSQPSPPLE